MSRKVNPTGLRVGVTKDWKSKWYAEDDQYGINLIEDDKIRRYLRKELKTSGLSVILIERSIKNIKITIRVARPGVVIGRRGTGLAKLREYLKEVTTADIDLQIEEIKNAETHARVVAQNVAMQLERRISSRRASNTVADKAIEQGAKGIKIQVSGTIYGPNSLAIRQLTTRGAVPTQTLRADIDYACVTASTRGGTIGVKVWVYKGEIVKEEQ